MTAYTVRTRPPGVSGVVDVFLGPAVIALALLFSLLIPVRNAYAQLSGTTGGAGVDYAYQRTMSRIAAGTSAGLGITSPATLGITRGGRAVGAIALNEARVMSTAAMAARAVSLPGMVALGATLLLEYGLQKCADGSWCKPATSEQAPNGRPYPSAVNYLTQVGQNGATQYFGDPESACRAGGVFLQSTLPGRIYEFLSATARSGGAQYDCTFNWTNANPARTFTQPAMVNRSSGCRPGHTLQVSTGLCFPPGYVPGGEATPASDGEVRDAWQRAFAGNTNAQTQLWSAEDQLGKDTDWANATAQPATVVGTGKVTDVQPAVSTTQDGKTTTRQTTCTYTGTPNTDSATMTGAPLMVGETCVTTTTNPDGTQTQETTTTAPKPAGGDNAAPPKVEVETCGLPGKPACKIDEAGTKTPEDVVASEQVAVQKIEQAKADNTVVLSAQIGDVEAKATAASAHWVALFNLLPTFGSEVCEPPIIQDDTAHVTLTLDICPHYYMAKDVFAIFIALGFLVDLAFMVRTAAAT